MNINELVRMAKKSAPELEVFADEDARQLLREAFRLIREEIDLTREGLVKVALLGKFHVTPAEREQDGKKVAFKRIKFRPAPPTAKL